MHRKGDDPVGLVQNGSGHPFFLFSHHNDEGVGKGIPIGGIPSESEGSHPITRLPECDQCLGQVAHSDQGEGKKGAGGGFCTDGGERSDTPLGEDHPLDPSRVACPKKSTEISGVLDPIDGNQGRRQIRMAVQKISELEQWQWFESRIHSLMHKVRSHSVQCQPGNEVNGNPSLPGSLQDFLPAGIRSGIILQIETGNQARLASQELKDSMQTPYSGRRLYIFRIRGNPPGLSSSRKPAFFNLSRMVSAREKFFSRRAFSLSMTSRSTSSGASVSSRKGWSPFP